MGIGIKELLVILVIVLLVFGTKKLRNLGGDLGAAIKNFRSSMRDGEQEAPKPTEPAASSQPVQPAQPAKLEGRGTVIEGQATREKDRA